MNKPYKILLIEDDINIVEILSYNIKKAGYNLFVTDNSDDAISVSVKESPDLIILDSTIEGTHHLLKSEFFKERNKKGDICLAFLMEKSGSYKYIEEFCKYTEYIYKAVKPGIFITRIKELLNKLESLQLKAHERELNSEHQSVFINVSKAKK
ncbi:MAG: hypothetical protein HYX39_09490 [Bacteroidetes bacterium]|nr:hypothetical protein [Bacteroidota bacterium]